jgi:Mn-dependent DtxR family transcriptional regulator
VPYDEEAETPPEPALSAAMFAEYARRSEVRKVVIAGALDVTPDKVTEAVRAMDDAGRYRLAQSLGIVP